MKPSFTRAASVAFSCCQLQMITITICSYNV